MTKKLGKIEIDARKEMGNPQPSTDKYWHDET